MPARIRLMVVDDHTLFRTALVHLLDEIACVQVVAEEEDGAAAVETAKRIRPDVVLMDYNLPGMNGVEATRRIMSACPDVRVLGLSMYDDERTSRPMLDAGASDFLSKKASNLSVLEAAIQQAVTRRLSDQADIPQG